MRGWNETIAWIPTREINYLIFSMPITCNLLEMAEDDEGVIRCYREHDPMLQHMLVTQIRAEAQVDEIVNPALKRRVNDLSYNGL